MPKALLESDGPTIEQLHAILEDGRDLGAVLAELHPAEIAHVLESLPPRRRLPIWTHLNAHDFAEVLAEADDAVRLERLHEMQPRDVAAIAEELEPDDAVDLLQDLPEAFAAQVLAQLGEQNREILSRVLAFPEDTAGGLMNVDVVSIRPDVTLAAVQRYLRARGSIPARTNRLMVVNRRGEFVGMLRVADLLTTSPQSLVSDVMDTELGAIAATTPATQVAQMFEQLNLLSAAVVDADGVLIGRITIDDVVDVIRDEGEESLMHMAGLDHHQDMFAPILSVARNRSLWLGVNLATALLASWVIGFFEATIQEVVALAVLMPVVASMGGIAGSQALTVVIRGMALGQVGRHNALAIVRQELLVGLINSLLWALVVALVALAWFGDPRLGVIVGVALVANLVVGAITGALVPLWLRKMRVDAALAGGVVLTTVTDVVGFVTFLGLGALYLI